MVSGAEPTQRGRHSQTLANSANPNDRDQSPAQLLNNPLNTGFTDDYAEVRQEAIKKVAAESCSSGAIDVYMCWFGDMGGD